MLSLMMKKQPTSQPRRCFALSESWRKGLLRGVITGALLVVSLPAWAISAQRVVSPSGLEAWLVEDHSIPVVAVKIGFRGGAALDPDGKEGRADLLAGLLDEGAGERDSVAFQNTLQENAISLSFDADRDQFTGSLRSLSEKKALAFELLQQSLSAPRFDAEAIERIRRQALANLAFASQDPDHLADEAWFAAAFPNHPYGRPVEGTRQTLLTMNADDLRAGVATLTRARLKVGVAGDMTPADVAAMLDQVFAALPAGQPEPPQQQQAPRSGFALTVHKDLPQAVAVFGAPAIDQRDPDFYAASVVNYIFGGGGFESRLMNEVREKRGLAYGVSTHLLPYDRSPILSGTVATGAPRMAESLTLIGELWNQMGESGPTAQELADAKLYLTGSYPLRFTSTGQVAASLMALQMGGFPLDQFETRNDKINAVTLEQAQAVAHRLFAPDRLSVVVVGPKVTGP